MKGIENRSKTKTARLLQLNSLTNELNYIKSKNETLNADYNECKSRYQSLYNESYKKIAMNKYLDDVENRAMTEFRLCYAQLTKSIEYLQACRDYGTEAENAEPWSDKDDEILELLNKAHDPLMYYNNNLVFKENPELLGEFFPEIYDKEGNKIAE